VTIPVSAYTLEITRIRSTIDIIVQTASIISTGAPIFINVSASLINTTSTIDTSNGQVKLYRGETLLINCGPLYTPKTPGDICCAFSYKDTPGPGTQTYYIKADLYDSNDPDIYIRQISLTLLETKK